MAVSQRTKLFLALGVALLMPLLGNLVEGFPFYSLDFLQKWIISSLSILVLWFSMLAFRFRKSSRRKKIQLILLTVFILLAISQTVFYVFDTVQPFEWTLLIKLAFISFFVYLIQDVIYTQDKLTRLLLEKEQLQTENLKIQLKELRNQMDPHFFFNSLNTLRSMVRQKHENSEEFIMGLSAFYRQMLKNQENTVLTLSEELNVLKSYLFLMKNRNEKALSTTFENVEENSEMLSIPTLALQSVVENCFKHNIMSSKMPLQIAIRNTKNGYIEVINNFQPKLSAPESSGKGLELLKRRYQLLKIENGVIVSSTPENFSVKLKLIPSS